jgi:transposase InsO family protein
VPYPPTKPGVEWSGGSVLREPQAGYVYQACLETLETVAHQVPQWIEHYNQHAPHSALGMQTPAEFYAEWLVKNKTRPVQI